ASACHVSHPGLASWATLSRPYGTVPGCHVSPQDFVLGYSQPSLRDWLWLASLPRTSSWATLSRPYGTGSGWSLSPGLRHGLFPVVPTGPALVGLSPQDFVMGYSQPSLRDWLWLASLPRARVLGYSQPSLRDWFWLVSLQDSRPGLFSAVPSGLVCDL